MELTTTGVLRMADKYGRLKTWSTKNIEDS